MICRSNVFSEVFFLTICAWLWSPYAGITRAQDHWPQWRGQKLDSVSTDSNVPSDLSPKSALKWRVELPGPAGASPIVWDNNIFVTTIDGDQNGDEMLLLCFGLDGKQKWKKTLEGRNQNYRDNANSASPSPSTDGKHVWVMMSNGILHCFTVGGDLVWKKDLQTAYGAFDIQFGMSSTPVLDRGRLYICLLHGDMRDMSRTSVGHVIAFNAENGEEIWYHKRLTNAVAENVHSYTSPTIYRDSEREFLITHGADFVIGHSLEDGSELWRCGGINVKGASYNPFLRFVASPACVPGLIVVPSAKRGPVLGLNPNLSGDVTNDSSALKWKLGAGTPDVSTPLIYDGYVYLAEERGTLRCLNAETGETVYEKNRLFSADHRSTPVAAEGKIFVTSRNGDLIVLKAGVNPEIISRVSLKEETTASVAIANGIIYVRTFNALYAFGG
jgi:outer membrane protein assembly factor BamB